MNRLSKFVAAPRVPHMQAATLILHYLKNSPGQGLMYYADSEIQLKSFADSDWFGYPDTQTIDHRFCCVLGSKSDLLEVKK